MQEPPHEVPGLAAALHLEQERRQLAFCDTLLPIGRAWAKQFTAAHWVALGLIGSPFLGGNRFTPFSRPAVLEFLWIVSPDYVAGSRLRALWFWLRNFSAVQPATARAIFDYLDAAFQDMPSCTASADRRSYYAGVASLVDLFAREYGWGDNQIMHTPLARLYQYFRCVDKHHNPRAIMHNPSDRVLGKWQHERAAAASKGEN